MGSSITIAQLVRLLLILRRPHSDVAAVAEATSIPVRKMRDLMAGNIADPDGEMLLALAEYLQISPEYFRCETSRQALIFVCYSRGQMEHLLQQPDMYSYTNGRVYEDDIIAANPAS